MTSPVWSAVVLHPADDVAVALRPLEPGPIALRSGDAKTFEVRAAIPLGHKFALRDIPVGADVRKYGEVIGIASTAIARGTHVHVQNLRSRRARTPAPPSGGWAPGQIEPQGGQGRLLR